MESGQTLGHYRILGKLGAGGMGEVYLAEDTTLKRQVALKVLPPDLAASRERLDRFQREAETLAALDHPNIVVIHTVEETDEIHFLTMQLVGGKRLAELIPKGGMRLERIFEIAIPLADALAAAHEKGVIHRDLKPGNIMVTDDGRVKVLDFGLAKLRPELDAGEVTELPTEPLTDEGRILGTVPYMSPEQLEGRELDGRTDIFSLGVVLYEMATGKRPFTGDSSVSIISSIIKDAPREVDTLRTDMPHHLGRIIRHCLEKDPARRYQSALDVRNELEDLRREEISHDTVATPPVAEPEGKANKRWWLAGAALLVLLGVASGYLLLRSEPRQAALIMPATEPPMIVVLPFENLGSPEDEYFADGMTEEITSRLAVVSGLRVISRTSAIQYKEERPPLKAIGSELGVDYVLEGSVRWARGGEGRRVRITPQLIRVRDDSHLWAASYDRVIEDVFAIQSDIASKVVDQLGVTLLEGEQLSLETPATKSLEAQHAYLRAKELVREIVSPPEKTEVAIQLFERAVELDPGFALAWAELARFRAFRWFHGRDQPEIHLAEAERAVQRLLDVDPDLPATRWAAGYLQYYGYRNFERALEEFNAAAQARPNDSEIRHARGLIYRRLGRWDEALAEIEHAHELNPRGYWELMTLVRTYRELRRYEDVDRSSEQAIALAPELYDAYYVRAWNLVNWKGAVEEARDVIERYPGGENARIAYDRFWFDLYQRRYEEALAYLKAWTPRTEADELSHLYRVGFWYWARGRLEEARPYLETRVAGIEQFLEKPQEDPRWESSLGMTLALLGRKEEAIRLAEQAAARQSYDHYEGPGKVHSLAQVYAWSDEADQAIDLLDHLLTIPYEDPITAWILRLDPDWDPLRDHPRFQALLEKHQQAVE